MSLKKPPLFPIQFAPPSVDLKNPEFVPAKIICGFIGSINRLPTIEVLMPKLDGAQVKPPSKLL
jgi:hypothetical protein